MPSRRAVHALHITDLHVLPVAGANAYGADTFETLRAVLAAALALPDPPALIVATGDLAEDGSEASYRRLRALLVETGLPAYVVPGNHDDVEAMQRALLGGSIQAGPIVDVASWRLVLLDSQVRGASHGHLAPAQLALLAAALAADPARPVVVALHHGPARYCPSSGCRLDDAEALVAPLLARPNARAVISGHAHLELARAAAHVQLLTTPSTCAQAHHAQPGDGVDHESFWSSHRFDAGAIGFRMLALGADGTLTSEVHWLRVGAAARAD